MDFFMFVTVLRYDRELVMSHVIEQVSNLVAATFSCTCWVRTTYEVKNGTNRFPSDQEM